MRKCAIIKVWDIGSQQRRNSTQSTNQQQQQQCRSRGNASNFFPPANATNFARYAQEGYQQDINTLSQFLQFTRFVTQPSAQQTQYTQSPNSLHGLSKKELQLLARAVSMMTPKPCFW